MDLTKLKLLFKVHLRIPTKKLTNDRLKIHFKYLRLTKEYSIGYIRISA